MEKTESPIRVGIANLFDSEKEFNAFLKTVQEEGTPLEEHPFGLSVNTSHNELDDVVILSYPGYTDSSVDAMKTVLRCAMSRDVPTESIKLRIIRGRHERDASKPTGYKHWLWFEVKWYQGTFICGGCNDFSGGGGGGGRKLESIFKALALLEDVTLEDVTIPLEKAEAARKFIFEAHDERSKERSAA